MEESSSERKAAGVDTEEEEEEKPMRKGHVSFSIWPPSDRTREAVRTRLAETLLKPSILSKRYGTMPTDEAEEASRRIEAEAYDSALLIAEAAAAEAEDGGMELLQAYSKEISSRMLHSVKSRSPPHDVINHQEKDEVASVEDK